VFVHTEPSVVYVSPTGAGDGSTAEKSTELQVALISGNVIAGDTIVMLDGIYAGNYMATINGSAENRIVIKSKTPYQAVIDGGLTLGNNDGVTGAYIDVKNIHITNLDANRGTWETEQGTIGIPTSMYVLAPYCRVLNNYIHDGGVGLAAYDKADSLVAYGNLIWNSGWADDVRGGAQNVYTHGANQTLKNNICVGGFKETFKAYSAGSYIRDYIAQNNVIFVRSTDVIGSESMRMSNISFIGNHILPKLMQVGYVFDQNDNAIVEDNIVYTPNDINGALNVIYFEKLSYKRNTIVGIRTWFKDPTDITLKDWAVDNNEYHEVGDLPNYDLDDFVSWQGWQAAGNDTNSTFDHLMPTENQTFVYPNEYYEAGDTRMGIIVIWNWKGDNTVEVDLTDLGLEVGTTYRWRQAQDPLVDVDTWECAGNSYTFAMTGHTVAKPIGFDEELIPTQFPTFGCFIIERV